MSDKKKKMKEVINKLKEAKEKLGEEKIKNISRPKKVKPDSKKKDETDPENRKRKKAPVSTATGPRGGSFTVSESGKKIYESSKREARVKKSMEDYLKHLEEIDRFINEFKQFKGLM